jgi:molybdopterin-guanine dinucleotide biosynthesis protein
VVGRKNHGKTTLIVELVEQFAQCGISVGILSPAMSAVFLPGDRHQPRDQDSYSALAPMFEQCQFVLVEGDSQTSAPKIEVWHRELGISPLAIEDASILAMMCDLR